MKKQGIFYSVFTGLLYLLLFVFIFTQVVPAFKIWHIVAFGAAYGLAFFVFYKAVRWVNFLLHSFFEYDYQRKRFYQLHCPLWRSIFFWPINLICGPFAAVTFLFYLFYFFFSEKGWGGVRAPVRS